jgi:hypothetical protein
MEPLMPPFDPDFDADNPHLRFVPERFVAEDEDLVEFDWPFWAETIFDPDL